MTLKIIMLIAAAGSGLLFIANAVGGEIARLAEDTQEYPSCDNCVGSVDSSICKFCNDGSCWEHKNDAL